MHWINHSFNLQQPTEEELSMPPKEAILQWYGVLSAEKVQMNATMINIRWLMKAGSHQLVTARGRQVLMDSMKEMGVLTMEWILVQQLPQSKCILNDGVPKYAIINSNHHVTTARQLFPDRSFKWCCDLVNVSIPYHCDVFLLAFFTHHWYLQENVSEDDIAILAWGCNYMHNDATVHKDEWEEFFQHFYRLQRGNYWKSKGKAVDWDKYINALVQSLLTYVVRMCMHWNCTVYMYALQQQLHNDWHHPFSLCSLKPTSSITRNAWRCANVCATTLSCWGNSQTPARRQDGARVSTSSRSSTLNLTIWCWSRPSLFMRWL